jgi:shikimate dehydrogenase
MQITGKTLVYMILGDPVQQVRAPVVFNQLFEQHGVDAVLVPVQVPVSGCAQFVEVAMRQSDIAGLWLTIPHKTPVVPVLSRLDRMAGLSGAVNAVRRGADGQLEGGLFDGLGFVGALTHHEVSVGGKCALLVGAGGAGLAIATALADRAIGMLHIADIDFQRAQAAAALVRKEFGVDASAVKLPLETQYDLVINATPLGLKASDPLPFDVSALDESTVVVDILMPRTTTRLLQACQQRGLKAIGGQEMLVQQVPEYLQFFGYDQIAHSVAGNLALVRELISQ